MDISEGSIRIPIEKDSEFQRAFSASFGTLACERYRSQSVTVTRIGVRGVLLATH